MRKYPTPIVYYFTNTPHLRLPMLKNRAILARFVVWMYKYIIRYFERK